jgi:hypothetical protein
LTVPDLQCDPLLKHSATPHFEAQYVADKDIGVVSWFQGMLAQVPKSANTSESKRIQEAV